MQLIMKQQMNEALKLVSERLRVAYDDLELNARDHAANQRERTGVGYSGSSGIRLGYPDIRVCLRRTTIFCSFVISMFVRQMKSDFGFGWSRCWIRCGTFRPI